MKLKLQNVFMGSFPILILFFIIPLSIYLPNQEDFNYNFGILFPFFLIAAVWCGLNFMVASIPGIQKSKLFVCLFYIGIFFLIKDAVAPVESKGLIGLDENIIIYEPLKYILIEILLIIIIVVSYKFIPKKVVKNVFLPTTILFILIQVIYSVMNIERPYQSNINNTVMPDKKVKTDFLKTSKKGNVYLICLDGSLSKKFVNVIKEGELEKFFAGFTCFINNKTNYTFTWPSIANSLSGSLYSDGSMRKWLDDSRKKDGLIRDFADNGYNVWMYSRYKHDSVPQNLYIPLPKKDLPKLNQSGINPVWLVRVVPTVLKRDVAGKVINKKKKSRIPNSNLIAASLDHLRMFVFDEEKRPSYGQFVFVHVYIPHKPYIYDKNCKETLDSGYIGQAACTLLVISQWIEQLKSDGKFDNSTIIIFGDHGMTGRGTGGIKFFMTKEFIIQLKKMGYRRHQGLALWASAMLLIKPPGFLPEEKRVLKISNRQTQNGDIAATLTDLTGVPINYKMGISVFKKEFPEGREVDIFDGFGGSIYKKLKRGLNPEKIRGELIHFKYSYITGWKYIKKIECIW